ncbi:hypothetical protein [Azotobacter chroococcum]|uniref:hypothetical protein n=1 Tax=Azotobacter chroococcum TaxID=353 RepID=UPI000589E1A1|nr:hypothetical protein [Azotobacter chroococcum]
MLIDLSESELIVIREAVREFRIAAPERIASNPGRLARWREERELWDSDRASVDRKMTDALAAIFDQKHAAGR